MKRNVFINQIEEGGLEMVDLESKFQSLKASWVPKLLQTTQDWAFIGKENINMKGLENILKLNFNNFNDMLNLNRVSSFYQEVIVYFNKSKIVKNATSKSEILEHTLWGNRFFKFYYKDLQQIKCLYFSEWISAGLIYVKCLKITNHKLDENYIYQRVQNKRNILQQIYILKQVLKPYLKYVQNHIPSGERETFINVPFYYSNGQTLTTNEINTNLLYHNFSKTKR